MFYLPVCLKEWREIAILAGGKFRYDLLDDIPRKAIVLQLIVGHVQADF